MSFFDLQSWKRAFGPSFRSFMYFSMIYVILVVLILIPFNILLYFQIDLSEIFYMLMALAVVFAFYMSFFKVLDEERPGQLPLKMV